MIENKKSQSGLNAAVLVAIIAGLIILYIIFLPTAEREKLIQDKNENPTTGEEKQNSILDVTPGLLSTTAGLESDKNIPNLFLVETVNAKELEKINPFIVRNGWFDTKTRSIDFEVGDLENTDNIVLSFTTKKRQGILTIKLNGLVIFENELATEITEPVRLDKKFLKKMNTLEFSVSSVGAKFWTTNEYSFENIKIIGDITDTTKQESTNLVTLSDSEISSMNKATLKFTPYCKNVNEVGVLDIFINDKKIFSSVPVCDNAYKQSIPKSILNQGENNVVFKTSKGSYSIEQIKLSLEFKEPTLKTYFFEIAGDKFKKIKSGNQDIILTIKFVDDKKQKRAKLDINGRFETVETDKALFKEKINSKILEGNNYVRLEPFGDMEVVELKIELS